MAPDSSPDRRREERESVHAAAILLLDEPAVTIAGELKNLTLTGFRVRHNCAALNPGQLARLRYGHEEKKVRVVWAKNFHGQIDCGLLHQEAYLIDCVRARQNEAFSQLIAPYMRGLQHTVNSILHNKADGEEALQEALLKVLLHLDQFRSGESFRPWLLQIATNEAFKHLRKNRRHSHDPIHPQEEDWKEEEWVDQFADPGESPADALERQEFAAAVYAAVESLDEIYRQVFVLRDLRQLAMVEVANVLGINVDTANTRLHRARLLMRKQLLYRYSPPRDCAKGRPKG